jgi:hypothetical protein
MSGDVKSFLASLGGDTTQQWMYSDVKHVNAIYSMDEELLRALEKFSSSILAPDDDKNLSTEIDTISSQSVFA